MNKNIIYYTDSRPNEPIISTCRNQLLKSGVPIISSSLQPLDFGTNFYLKDRERSYCTMVDQILLCLENSPADYVFFCEHDVLYHPSHFDFTPPKDNIFYYNDNVWRWAYGSDTLIRHERMLPLSCMCANRIFALNHYRMRAEKIKEWGLDKIRSREPRWARKWGYEPGTKKRRRGGFTDDDFDTWTSELPNIDIRHGKTFSKPKIKMEDFKHKPGWWKEIKINEVPYWNLKEVFNV